MTFHNIPAGLQIFVFFLIRDMRASSCDTEQHKQLCLPRGGLLCPSPVPGILLGSFASKSVTKDVVRLGFGGLFLPCGGVFLFPLVFVVGIATIPANPGSLLTAACRLTNLARSFRAGIGPFSLIEYDTLVHVLIK